MIKIFLLFKQDCLDKDLVIVKYFFVEILVKCDRDMRVSENIMNVCIWQLVFLKGYFF